MDLLDIPAQHAIDAKQLTAWMDAHIEGFTGPIEMRQFSGGQSNPTFLVNSPGRSYVLRRKPTGKLLPSAHAIDREFRMLTVLKDSNVPVARAYAFCEDVEVIGSTFYVMDYVEGRIFWDAKLPEVEPADRGAIYSEMIRVQAALHSVDYRALGLGDFGKTNDYIRRQVLRWTQQYRASETEKIDAIDHLIEWLPQHIPPDEQTAIVHGDYRLDNAIFHPRDPVILAVLDWELSTLGHPLVDFAYFCMRHHLTSMDFRGLDGVDTAALGIPSEAESVAHYCKLRGVPPISNQEWTYYLAFCMFRLASILQGVLARALQGSAPKESALESGRRARLLAESGWKLVRESFEV